MKYITAPNYCFLEGAVIDYSWNGGKIYIYFSGERFRFSGGGVLRYSLFKVRSDGEDAPPGAAFPPRPSPPAAGKSRPGWARGKGAQEQEAAMQASKPCPQDCKVGIALALHSVQQVKLRQECKRAAALMHRRTTCTHSRAHTHTCTGANIQAHTRTDTHAQAHTRAHAHKTFPGGLVNTCTYGIYGIFGAVESPNMRSDTVHIYDFGQP